MTRRAGIRSVIEGFQCREDSALSGGRSHPHADFSSDTGDTVGVRIVGSRRPGFPHGARVDTLLRASRQCRLPLFDGTVYTDDEMIAAGVGWKTGGRMGHMAMSGEAGSIAALADVNIGRRVFVHINNTNPVLDESSAEHAAVRKAGWELARDNMELEL